MKDAKYLLAYLVPGLVFLSIWLRGVWSFLAIIVLFGVVPLLEHFFRGSEENLSQSEENAKKHSLWFDILLYLNVPVQYGILIYFLTIVRTESLTAWEMTGMILSMGISCGTLGINVAHELGHRASKGEQFLAQMLLLTSLYMHFFIEHNRGHHKYVATLRDPATARKGEPLYAFWIRSIRDGYLSAWKIEYERLKKADLPVFSTANQMLMFQLFQLQFLVAIALIWGLPSMLAFMAAALVGVIELETVNYLEHYGLLRKETRPGYFEKVQPWHSWNTNRTLGRILLYELTRHSDHHYRASRKYQILRHFGDSPQLPQGYPGMMILATVPPLWFRVMDKKLEELENQISISPLNTKVAGP
ncbi:MAG: alkane 1-monooxygenase [Bacteroidia bacterium]